MDDTKHTTLHKQTASNHEPHINKFLITNNTYNFSNGCYLMTPGTWLKYKNCLAALRKNLHFCQTTAFETINFQKRLLNYSLQ